MNSQKNQHFNTLEFQHKPECPLHELVAFEEAQQALLLSSSHQLSNDNILRQPASCTNIITKNKDIDNHNQHDYHQTATINGAVASSKSPPTQTARAGSKSSNSNSKAIVSALKRRRNTNTTSTKQQQLLQQQVDEVTTDEKRTHQDVEDLSEQQNPNYNNNLLMATLQQNQYPPQHMNALTFNNTSGIKFTPTKRAAVFNGATRSNSMQKQSSITQPVLKQANNYVKLAQ